MTKDRFERYRKYLAEHYAAMLNEGGRPRTFRTVHEARILTWSSSRGQLEYVSLNMSQRAGLTSGHRWRQQYAEREIVATGMDAIWAFENDTRSRFFEEMGLEILT